MYISLVLLKLQYTHLKLFGLTPPWLNYLCVIKHCFKNKEKPRMRPTLVFLDLHKR